MPYQFSIHSHLVHVRWQGILVQEEVETMTAELPRLAAQLGYLPEVLHTFEDVHALQLSVPVSWSRGPRSRSPFGGDRLRMALVTNRPILMGVERMFHALPHGPAMEIQRFINRQDAIDWLVAEKIEATFAEAGA